MLCSATSGELKSLTTPSHCAQNPCGGGTMSVTAIFRQPTFPSASIYEMTEPTKHLDIRLLQARWVLGGVAPEEWVDQAISALDQGFDGTALRQLAGLVRPTQRYLGLLPERALAEMGLDLCDKERAISLLVARGALLTSKTILSLIERFPAFSPRWRKHLEYWHGDLLEATTIWRSSRTSS